MNMTAITGIAASTCTGISLLPQLVKIIKDKKAGDISLLMLAVLGMGLGLWVYYGFCKADWIIVVSNAFSFLVNAAIGWLTLKYKR